jgi:hypothetical protein
LNFIILVWFIPMLGVFLFAAQLTLMTLEYFKPVKDLMQHISNKDGGGLSMCSWYSDRYQLLVNFRDDPGMFDRLAPKITKAKKVMGSPRNLTPNSYFRQLTKIQVTWAQMAEGADPCSPKIFPSLTSISRLLCSRCLPSSTNGFSPTLFPRVDGLEIPISLDLLPIFMMQRSVE